MMRSLICGAGIVLALAGCGGDPTPVQPGEQPSTPSTPTNAGHDADIKVIQVYRPEYGLYVECAVLIGPDDSYASRSVALDCNWP